MEGVGRGGEGARGSEEASSALLVIRHSSLIRHSSFDISHSLRHSAVLEAKHAVAGVIGLGYVGLPLAVELARNNVRTIGFDVDIRKISELAAGRSYIPDVPSDHVAQAVNTGMLTPTTDPASLAEADVIDICVPTPLRKTKDPDLSYVVKAVETTAAVLRRASYASIAASSRSGGQPPARASRTMSACDAGVRPSTGWSRSRLVGNG